MLNGEIDYSALFIDRAKNKYKGSDKMTIEELEALADAVENATDESARKMAGVDLKVAMREYKKERDDTELEHMGRIEELEKDVADRDADIEEIRKTNSTLALKYAESLKEDDDKNEPKPDESDEEYEKAVNRRF